MVEPSEWWAHVSPASRDWLSQHPGQRLSWQVLPELRNAGADLVQRDPGRSVFFLSEADWEVIAANSEDAQHAGSVRGARGGPTSGTSNSWAPLDGHLEVLDAVVGSEAKSVQRVRYVFRGKVDSENGPIQFRFDSNEVRCFDAGPDGEALAVATSPWADPFNEPLSEENRRFIDSSGKWAEFDVSTEAPYSASIGRQLVAHAPIRTADGKLVGLVLDFGGGSITLETHGADELFVTVT